MLKIKKKYLNKSIGCPNTKRTLKIGDIKESEFHYYYTHGLSEIFEEYTNEINEDDFLKPKKKKK